jgi:hypothetical protein
MKFDWRSVVGTIAPTIATALGGPLAGLATKAIAEAVGLPKDADETQIETAVKNATPDQLLAIKKADNDFIVQMKALEVDLEKVAAGDRDSARRREVATQDSTPKILATLVFAAWIYIQWHLLNDVVPEASRGLITRMLGTMDAVLLAVVYYYFGSSARSGTPTTSAADRRK